MYSMQIPTEARVNAISGILTAQNIKHTVTLVSDDQYGKLYEMELAVEHRKALQAAMKATA